MDPASIEAVAATVEAIISAAIRAAPAIERGVATAAPYVDALVGLVSGNEVTQADLDAAVASVKAQSDRFQEPLPPDDGTTNT